MQWQRLLLDRGTLFGERDDGTVRIRMEVVGTDTECDQPKGPGAGMPGAGKVRCCHLVARESSGTYRPHLKTPNASSIPWKASCVETLISRQKLVLRRVTATISCR